MGDPRRPQEVQGPYRCNLYSSRDLGAGLSVLLGGVTNLRNFEPLLPAVLPTSGVSRPAIALPTVFGSGRERVLRVLYLGRLSLASAIFIAAIVVWRAADTTATLVATLAFVATLIFTGASLVYSERTAAEPGDTFFYVQ